MTAPRYVAQWRDPAAPRGGFNSGLVCASADAAGRIAVANAVRCGFHHCMVHVQEYRPHCGAWIDVRATMGEWGDSGPDGIPSGFVFWTAVDPGPDDATLPPLLVHSVHGGKCKGRKKGSPDAFRVTCGACVAILAQRREVLLMPALPRVMMPSAPIVTGHGIRYRAGWICDPTVNRGQRAIRNADGVTSMENLITGGREANALFPTLRDAQLHAQTMADALGVDEWAQVREEIRLEGTHHWNSGGPMGRWETRGDTMPWRQVAGIAAPASVPAERIATQAIEKARASAGEQLFRLGLGAVTVLLLFAVVSGVRHSSESRGAYTSATMGR